MAPVETGDPETAPQGIQSHWPVIAWLLHAPFLPGWATGFACQRENDGDRVSQLGFPKLSWMLAGIPGLGV